MMTRFGQREIHQQRTWCNGWLASTEYSTPAPAVLPTPSGLTLVDVRDLDCLDAKKLTF